MPVIRISDSNSKKLQKLAIPLVDNHDSVIGRLIDAALAGVPYQIPSEHHEQSSPSIGTPSVEEHDDLTHTRIRSASFDGVSIPRPNWNDLARHAHEKAFKVLGSFEELKLATQAHIREGKYEKDGFIYLEDIDLSIQGTSANVAWENTLRIARKMDVPVEVAFEWHNKPKATRPGESDTLSWKP